MPYNSVIPPLKKSEAIGELGEVAAGQKGAALDLSLISLSGQFGPQPVNRPDRANSTHRWSES